MSELEAEKINIGRKHFMFWFKGVSWLNTVYFTCFLKGDSIKIQSYTSQWILLWRSNTCKCQQVASWFQLPTHHVSKTDKNEFVLPRQSSI